MNFICVDIEKDRSVDVVVVPGEKLPFANGSVDLVVSTSCFEHDPCFWITFREIARVLKKGGYFYINAPSNGVYHRYGRSVSLTSKVSGRQLALLLGRRPGTCLLVRQAVPIHQVDCS